MSVASNIQQARKAAKLTQAQLAEKIGKGFSTVQKYELGLAKPPIDVMQKIAEALDVPLTKLVASEDAPSELTWPGNLDHKLRQVGCSIGGDDDEAMLWINFPDGTLEVTDDDLRELHESSNDYMRFKLDELRKLRASDFRPKGNGA